MKTIVYNVHAYRWGERESHSYLVGVYSKKHRALKEADTEEQYRGGKYTCEVLEVTIDEGVAGNCDIKFKVIKALPQRDAEDIKNTMRRKTAEARPFIGNGE